jgi:hypothetical protein
VGEEEDIPTKNRRSVIPAPVHLVIGRAIITQMLECYNSTQKDLSCEDMSNNFSVHFGLDKLLLAFASTVILGSGIRGTLHIVT